MNRSILIVICDFLLVSLLAFSTVDIKKVGQEGTPQMKPAAAPTNAISAKQDLGDVMRLALDEERKNRDQLTGDLERARETVNQQNQQIQNVRSQLETKEQLAARLERERSALEQNYAAAQTNLAGLSEQLHTTAAESALTREQRAAMEAEARKQSDRAELLAKQLADLEKNHQSLQVDQRNLQNQLLLSEASNHSAFVQVAQLQDEVTARRQENGRLADNFKMLAANSSELVHEMHDNRQLTPNFIFEEMVTNRVQASFTGVKSGILGLDSTKERQAQIILVTDGTNTFALAHVQNTPLTLWAPGTQWQELNGTLTRDTTSFPIQSLSFCFTDPRIVYIPVREAETRALGCKIYHLAKDPFLFQDAVVVGTRGDYYGECRFQNEVSTPHYLKMDHNSLKGLFGKFNPSSGDLVLSKTGELLGVMANNSYCALIRGFDPVATLHFGPASRNQGTAQTLSALYSFVADMPTKLQ